MPHLPKLSVWIGAAFDVAAFDPTFVVGASDFEIGSAGGAAGDEDLGWRGAAFDGAVFDPAFFQWLFPPFEKKMFLSRHAVSVFLKFFLFI